MFQQLLCMKMYKRITSMCKSDVAVRHVGALRDLIDNAVSCCFSHGFCRLVVCLVMSDTDAFVKRCSSVCRARGGRHVLLLHQPDV